MMNSEQREAAENKLLRGLMRRDARIWGQRMRKRDGNAEFFEIMSAARLAKPAPRGIWA